MSRDLRPRSCGDIQLDATNTGAMQRDRASRYEPRNGRFDVTLRDRRTSTGAAPTQLRFTGTAIETVEAAVLARGVERSEVLKSADVVVERRPKAEVGSDAASRDRRSACRRAADPRRPGRCGPPIW